MDMIKASALKEEFLKKQPNGIPLIFLSISARAMRKLGNAGYTEVSLNRELSQILMGMPVEQRPLFVLEETRKIIAKRNSGVILRDFEMLFDPNYHLDVLKVFCELARQFRIAIIWCGTFHDNVLEFAEPDYSDYHSYHVDQYTVYCIN